MQKKDWKEVPQIIERLAIECGIIGEFYLLLSTFLCFPNTFQWTEQNHKCLGSLGVPGLPS